MSQGNLAIENILVILDLDQAIAHLKRWMMLSRTNAYLLVVLSDKASQAVNRLAHALKLNVTTFAAPDTIVNIDINVVNTGRDLPQDVISQDARNLKTKLILSYRSVYRQVSSRYPNEKVILVDELTKSLSTFHLDELISSQATPRSVLDPTSNVKNTMEQSNRSVYFHS